LTAVSRAFVDTEASGFVSAAAAEKRRESGERRRKVEKVSLCRARETMNLLLD